MFRNTALIRVTRFSLLFSLLVLFFTSAVFSAEFIIFHTSDIHGAINAHPDPAAKETPKPLIGGFSVLQNLMNSYKNDPAHYGKRIMYLDSGDFFQGTPIVDRTKGAVMIDMLNRMKVDAVTLGNHEFDYSYQNLIEQMGKKEFPVICCNVFEKATGKIPFFCQPYMVFTHQGRKIGLIGVDTPDTASISFEKNVKDLIFAEPEPIVRPIVSTLRKSGVDFIILLSHLGYAPDLKIAAQIEGIDLILGGHNHLLKTEFTWVSPYNTAVVHPGSSCEHVSIIHLNLESPGEPMMRLESVPLLLSEIGEDPAIKAVEESYLKDLRVEMQQVIGRSEVNLFRGISGGDSPEGSVIADAMRRYSEADVAFINFGGIRQPIFKGDITVEDAFMVQPFDNFVEIMNLTGAQLRNLVERSLSNDSVAVNDEDRKTTLANFNMSASGLKLVVGPDYGYLLPSGLFITYDPEKPKMQRLISLTTDKGEQIDDTKIYKVAINDFLADGGDGYTVLREYRDRYKMDLLVRDALIRYIKDEKVIAARPEKRITNIKLEEACND